MKLYNLNKNKIFSYKYFNSNIALLYSIIFVICLGTIPYIMHSKTIYYKEFYTAIQFSSSIVAYIAAFTCLMYFLATKEEFYIIITLIYFLSASDEFAKVLMRILSDKRTSVNFIIEYVKTTHILNKVLISIVLFLACFYNNKLVKGKKKKFILLVSILFFITITTLSGMLIIKYFGYSKAMYNLSIAISSFSLFIASLYFVFSTLKKKKDIFSSMLLASLIFIFFSEVYLLFFKTHYDISFVASSISNMLGNAMPILGISVQFVSEIKKVNFRISESSKIEKKLKKSEKKLREITDNMIDIICKLDRYGIIEYISSSYCNLSKRNYKEFRGKHIHKIIHPDDLKLVDQVYRRVKDSGISERVEYRLKIFNNEYIWVESIIGVLLDDTGEINGSIISSRDITDKRKLAETMEYDRIKTEFFANISHELRTPINVIFSALQVVEMYSFKDNNLLQLNKYNKIMKQNCYRLLRLVSNLIDITKIDSGYLKLQLGNYDIVKIVEDITMSVVDYAENKGISIIFDTDIEEKIIACDPDKIERIVMNLLSNAVKFTQEKGNICVSIHNGKKDNLYISVKDSGRGIPKEKLDIIFERFRQVDKSLARDHEGSGIGLSLVKSLVELHGGNVKVRSEVGLGSEFIIELPCRYIKDHDRLYESNEIKQSHIERINIEFSDIYGI